MQRVLLVVLLAGCASASATPTSTVVSPAAHAEPVAEVTPRATPSAPAALVPQGVHGDDIYRVIAWPGVSHFFVDDRNGVLSVAEASTGAIRTSMRPSSRGSAVEGISDDGMVVLIDTGVAAFVWTVSDDRVREIDMPGPMEVDFHIVRLDPAGERVLVLLPSEDESTIRIEDRASGALVATRTLPGVFDVRWSGTGRTVLAELREDDAPHTLLLDPDTLATRHDLPMILGESEVVRRSERIVLFKGEATELRSTLDGSVVGTAPAHGFGNPEGYVSADGRCVLVRTPGADNGYALYDTERFRRVMQVPLQGRAEFAVMDGCAGFFASMPDGTITEWKVGGPDVGVVFARIPAELHEGSDRAAIALLGPDSLVASVGSARMRFERGREAPAFVVGAGSSDRERSIWRFGFLPSGGVYTSGRGFVDLFGPTGYRSSSCEGAISVVVPPTGRRALVGVSEGVCDVESGEVLAVRRVGSSDLERFVLGGTPRGAVVADMERFTTTPVRTSPPLALPHPISPDGALSAHFTERTSTIQVFDLGTSRSRARFRLANGETSFMLLPAGVAAWSRDKLTVYGFDGAPRYDRPTSEEMHLPSATFPFATFETDDSVEVVRLETGDVVATVRGTIDEDLGEAVQGQLLVVRTDAGRVWVRAEPDGTATQIPLPNAPFLGTSADLRRVALCVSGELKVFGISADGSPQSFGACLTSDSVEVHERASAVLHLRGTRLVLRTPDAPELAFTVVRRGDAPIWFAASADGRYAAPEGMLAEARHREAGPLLTAPLSPLDPARRTLDVLAPLGSLGR